jgi:hypothetical protein
MELVKRVEEEPEPKAERHAIRWPLFLESGDHRYRVVTCGADLDNGVWLEKDPAEGETELCRHDGEQDEMCLGISIPIGQILGALIRAGERKEPS